MLSYPTKICWLMSYLSVPTGGTYAQQAAALATPLDILVATPQKLLQHAEKGNVFYGDVQYVVLDEADTMFDRGFGPEVERILRPLRSKPQPAQCILVAATLTKVRPVAMLLDLPGLLKPSFGGSLSCVVKVLDWAKSLLSHALT